ncbi:hypothetical protein M409DRAFT_61355 [Zasmidium cellare ATCC 36951]|uniref:Uncharacterized protein n=1 Tax=Zasmidium cellare ATCC 36951 TaxID=1080233 RepID=A0A6A6BZB8_ZASCE|nr:uncharacterized protein M409DRAFT_61355 [Zasmidium cellare ATCC 36951]KAF2158766.1 hypothetical protein M409DRAFT_61355 [Zasmidium cellare ATCC 36951]
MCHSWNKDNPFVNFGGIATIPRATREDYSRKPMQFILGYFDGEDVKLWSRSILGRVLRQKAIDEIVDTLIVQAGGVLQPTPKIKEKRATKWRRQEERDEDEG